MMEKESSERSHWSFQKEVNEAVLNYLCSYGGYPKKNLGKVQRFLQPFLDTVESALWEEGIVGDWETVGSVSEGVHEIHPDGSYELDMKYTISVDSSLVSIKKLDPNSNWATLRKSYWSYLGFGALLCLGSTEHSPPIFNGYEEVSKEYVLDVFEETCELSARQHVPNARFSRHGPAITMKAQTTQGLRFSVDLVPAVSIQDRGAFVAKPGPSQANEAWNMSFSLEELDQ